MTTEVMYIFLSNTEFNKKGIPFISSKITHKFKITNLAIEYTIVGKVNSNINLTTFLS